MLTPGRGGDEVYRHRFTAAHELGHLVLHGDARPVTRSRRRRPTPSRRSSSRLQR
ncbi:ImmA/IrrE family metallo-endopeptidase [Jiangella gansuensis]|uniref:ImmA/IrrE family metallo-endopeptidase n=1 Tax=Jiangella gansuensis TaxID=281473 RepID=UPI00316AE7F1